MIIFPQMGATLKQGWSSVSSWWKSAFTPAIEKVTSYLQPVPTFTQKKFFPAPQKTIITPSIVSEQTYRSYPATTSPIGNFIAQKLYTFGQSRAVAVEKEAPTFWGKFKGWWQSKVMQPYKEAKVGEKVISTLVDTIGQIGQVGVQVLANKYNVNQQGAIEPQYKSPPTEPAPSLWDLFMGGGSTQPVQTYGSGYEPYNPIPSMPYASGEVPTQFNWTPVIVAGGVLALILVTTRGRG